MHSFVVAQVAIASDKVENRNIPVFSPTAVLLWVCLLSPEWLLSFLFFFPFLWLSHTLTYFVILLLFVWHLHTFCSGHSNSKATKPIYIWNRTHPIHWAMGSHLSVAARGRAATQHFIRLFSFHGLRESQNINEKRPKCAISFDVG